MTTELSGHTTPFAVLGHPIGHSLSPAMHNAALADLQMDAVYLAFDVAPERLMGVLLGMADMGFRGVNLTVPLKEVAFRGLGDLDASARNLGAVNTVEFAASGLRGHNTDGAGFLRALAESFDTRVSGKRVFVLGTGGAGRAVAITAALEGAAQVVLADADPVRPGRVIEEISVLAPTADVVSLGADRARWVEGARAAEIVVQATPVGMQASDTSLLGAEAFHDGQLALDLIYMYRETVFMAAARAGGARAANGLGMLLHQGARALSIWTGREPPIDVMRAALEQRVYRTTS